MPNVESGHDLTWIAELRDRPVKTGIARRADGQLVVVETFPAERASIRELTRTLRTFSALERLVHPHVVRVRSSWTEGEVLVVQSDYVEGETLASLFALAAERGLRLPVDAATRIVADVLAGLSALHGVSDVSGQLIDFAHGEIAPRNVVIGIDGRARVAHPCRPGADPTRSARLALPYMAPEALSEGTINVRTDVYGAGAVLFQALDGAPPFDPNRIGILASHARGVVRRSTPPPADTWATPLSTIAAKAMASEPHERYASASEMAAELRRATTTRMASPARVSEVLEEIAGDSIRRRRERLG